jgi:DNA-binding NarL/FixJ family response regulator
MRIAVYSPEGLLREGVACLLKSSGHEVHSSAVGFRDLLPRLAKGDYIIVDARHLSPEDSGYLSAAQTFGGFRVVVLTGEDEGAPSGLDNCLSRFSGADTLLELVGPVESARQQRGTSPRPASSRTQPKSKGLPAEPRRRGRPPQQVNSLPLSRRQYEAAQLIARGASNSEIARVMNLRDQSAKNLVGTILKRLELADRNEVAARIGESVTQA